MHHISADGVGEEVGTLTITETKDGIVVTPNLHGFRPRLHAFHAHENPSCEPGIEAGKMEAARAAGPHYNGPAGQAAVAPTPMPDGMKMNGMVMAASTKPAPMRGNMPELTAAADGTITKPVGKTGLTFDELRNRSFVIHPYGEEGSDPERPKDSSASAHIACAVLPK